MLKDYFIKIFTVLFMCLVVFTISQGGPEFWAHILDKIEVTQGVTKGCAQGENYSYSYIVGNNAYSKDSAVCKGLIPAGKSMQVYYAASNPDISWPFDPRGLAASVFAEVFIVSNIVGLLSVVVNRKNQWGQSKLKSWGVAIFNLFRPH